MNIDLKARKLLIELRQKVESETAVSVYGDRARALNDIDSLLNSPSAEGIKYLLLPTANLHELAIDNNWAEEFSKLANQLEDLLKLY